MPPKVSKTLLRFLLWRPQLSHLVALMACLLLSLRLNHVIEYFNDEQEMLNESPLNLGQPVQAEPTQEKEGEKISAPQTPPHQESTNEHKTPQEQTVSSQEGHTTKNEPSKKEESPPMFDSLSLDENQIRVFKALSERNHKIDQESEHMEQQQKLMELGEKKLAEQIKTLQEMKKSIEDAKQSLTKEEKENVTKMVKIYEGMNPEEAADIFNKLHVVVVAKLLQAMNQKKAAPILSAMDKSKARMVTLEIISPKEPIAANETEEPQENQPKDSSQTSSDHTKKTP